MGSSFASDLRRGQLPEVETMIRRGRDALKNAIAELYELAADETQYDNATDTGEAIGALSNACLLIDTVLPSRNDPTPAAITVLRALLAEPYGCSLCDSGKPRVPAKGHQPDCPYEAARKLIESRS